MRIALLHPPDGMIPAVPYASLATLNACLRAAGHEVLLCDAGLEVFLAMLVRERLEAWYDRAEAVRDDLEREGSREEARARELHRLQRLLAVPRSLFAEVEDSLAVLRDRKRFVDPDAFNRAHDVVQGCSRFAFSLHPDSFPEERHVGHAVLAAPTPGPLPDPPIEAYGPIVDRVLAERPDLVGITVPYDCSIFYGLKLARAFKEEAPWVPIAMGGAAIDSETYPVTRDPFYFRVLDCVMVGEGEVEFPRLANALEKGEDPSGVRNLRWLRPDGTLGKSEFSLVTDLNAVPAPDYSGLRLADYLLPDPVATFQTSRGCYYGKCTFCSELFRKSFRLRQPDLVVEDMVSIHRKTGIRHFHLWDSLAPPKTLKRIAQAVKERGLPFEWLAETKFEKPYRDEETIRALAEGGCRFLLFGLESASPRVLDRIDKGNDLADVDRILAHLKKHGIRAGTSWFIGFPGESEREADVTHDFIGARRDRILLSNYIGPLEVGTDTILYEHPERFGIALIEGPGGSLDYRYLDGRSHWDREERDRAFQSRGDFDLVKANVEIPYARVPVETALRITGQHRRGPLLRHIAPGALPSARFRASPDLRLREYDRHPLRPDSGPYAVAFQLSTSLRFDVDHDGILLLRALSEPLTLAQIPGATGIDEARLPAMLDHAINRGLVTALVGERDVEWIPEASLAAAP